MNESTVVKKLITSLTSAIVTIVLIVYKLLKTIKV